jgi:N-acetylneuraminate synthase/N,N'-diacetyllegionaminate synthase
VVNERAGDESLGPCRIVASIDGNHNGDPDLARRLIDAAREAGADGVKFQKRTVALSAVRQVLEHPSDRFRTLGSTYGKALERIDFPVEVLARLCEHAQGMGLLMAPQDVEACVQLSGLSFSAWQVDSPFAVHLPLLETLERSGRPVVVSIGGCTEREVGEVVRCFARRPLTLVHTLHTRPFAGGIVDVASLVALRRFGCSIGYADHCLDLSLSLAAVALGATLIEKPLTLDRAFPGPEHAGSLRPHELGELVSQVRRLEAVLGAGLFRDPSPEEMDNLEWGRVSIVAACPIPRGTRIRREMLTLKAPFRGLSPEFLGVLEGRRALYDIGEDEFLTFGMVEL